MKKFGITFSEEVNFFCYVEILANSKKEALKKFENGEFKDYDRHENNNSFGYVGLNDIEEVEETEEAEETQDETP